MTHMLMANLCQETKAVDPDAHEEKFVEHTVHRYTGYQFKGLFLNVPRRVRGQFSLPLVLWIERSTKNMLVKPYKRFQSQA